MATPPVGTPASYGGIAKAPNVPPTAPEASPAPAPKPRLLDRVREAIRTHHYSRRTEDAYVAWILAVMNLQRRPMYWVGRE